MSGIHIYPSIALDTICFLEKRSAHKEWLNKEQNDIIGYINSLLPRNFDNDYLSMSTLSLILSAYTGNNLESMRLDEMINILEKSDDIQQTVKSKIPGGYTASYTYPVLEMLKNGWDKKYTEKLNILRQINYESIYAERVLPLVKNEIRAKQTELGKIGHAQLLDNISRMKNTPQISDVKIFVSFFSWPTAFTLYNGSFLTCFTPEGSIDFIPIIAHELMHGFASSELIELYRKYINEDEYLSQTYKRLTGEFQSGDEEEFVMAAEYYLCMKSGLYSKSELMKTAKERYDGCCPVAAIIFELLSKEEEVPADYNQWLINAFREKRWDRGRFCV